MTTYYVRATGSDGAAGTSPGAAWATVTHAISTVTAGDTVYIGAGFYSGALTLATSGSSGSTIKWYGDIDGTQTGDAGLVFVTPMAAMLNTATGSGSTLDLNGKTFNEFYYIVFGHAGNGTNDITLINNAASSMEGVIFDTCTFLPPLDVGVTISLSYVTGVAITGNKPIIRDCVICGNVSIVYTTFSADVACGIQFNRNVVFGTITLDGGNTGSFGPTGYNISNNTIIFSSTTDIPISIGDQWGTGTIGTLANNTIIGTNATITFLSDSGAWVGGGNIISSDVLPGVSDTSSNFKTVGDLGYSLSLIGMMVEHIYRKFFGWTPFSAFEPVVTTGIVSAEVDCGLIDYLPAIADLAGNSIQTRSPNQSAHIYYMDASDDAVSDPNTVWNNDANAVNGSKTSRADTTSTGSTSSNYLFAGGTNAPGSGGSIVDVYARVYKGGLLTSAAADTVIYTDGLGETLATISWTAATDGYTSWSALTAPSGGWTWAKIQALEFKCYKTGGSTPYLYQIEIGVLTTEIAPDAGAVEARSRPARESTTVHGGAYAMKFSAAGYYEMTWGVDGSEQTISVYCRKDSDYAGTAPKLEILEGATSLGSDSLSVGADTWEQLSVTFTPSAAGRVRVRLTSYGIAGNCFFDDLT